MKTAKLALTLSITVAAVCAATYAQSDRSEKAPKAIETTRQFTSELGFDLSYPAKWTLNDLGPLMPAEKMALDKQSETDPYRRSIECSQNIFSARIGDPRSNFLTGAITTECMGAEPDLDSFTSRTMRSLEGRYQLSETRYAGFSVQGQTFWAMRTLATDRRDRSDTETIEYLATVLPTGLVYWSAHSRNQQAQSGFEHAHLHLAAGVDTELIPAGVFEGTKSPESDFTSLGTTAAFVSRIPATPNASHHFESGLGFTYDVPSNLRILDTQEWEEANRRDSSGQIIASHVSPSHRRRTLLVAQSEDSSKLLVLTTCTNECLGSLGTANDLPLLIAADVLDLARKFTLGESEYGSFSAGAHSFSVMRSTATLKNRPWESAKYLALVITPIANGVAEFFLLARTRADLDALLATRAHFDEGAETELIPAETLTSEAQQPHVSNSSIPTEPAPATALAGAAKSSTDYSAEPVVIEQLNHTYVMAADGTGVRQITVVARVQSDASVRQLGVLSIPYAGSSEHIELAYVRVRRPDGSVTETPLTAAIEMPSAVTTQAPFYSDLKELQIPVRNLRVGDHLEWQAKIIRTKPEAPGQFWGAESFVSDAVVLSQTVELHVPKDIYVNVWSPTSRPIESTTSTEHIYRWESSQTRPTVGTAAEAEKERKKKQVWTAEQELDEKEGKLPSVAWTTFRSWDAVGAWYRSIESDRVLPDPEIQAKVAELTAGKTTQEEKVRALYGYVSTQIRYIGVDFGIGRYQPHRAAEVLQNQYGDCKDKHTLLAAMLEVLGIHSDAVLIGAGIRFNEAVPSPQSFNHLVTRVSAEGQPIWLDSTAEVAPYRVLNYAIRGKNALVVPDSGIARIDRTPADLPFPEVQKMDAVGTLDDTGTSNSHIALTLRGDNELLVRSALHQVSPGQYDQLVQQLSLGMGYGGTTSHAEVSSPENTTEPLKISYDYKREKAGDWDNLRIVPQVTPVALPHPDEKDPPIHFIALGTPRTEISTSAMKLPVGWRAELPAAVHVKSPWATYDETYRFENGTVYAERRVRVLQEKVPVADWRAYKSFADESDLGNEKYIQLSISRPVISGITGSGGTKVSHTPTNGNPFPADVVINEPKAAKLILAARVSIQHREFETAQSQLDEARSLNHNQARLWAIYGYLEFQRGNMFAAIEDYKKELALYADNYGTYSSLAEAQNILGQEKDAEGTLQQWASVQSDSPAPVIALVSLLLDEGHPSQAVDAAQAGIARLPEMRKDDQRLQLLTAKAQLAAGMKQKGESALLALLNATSDPGMMNDAAYELGKAGLDLPLAETTARYALEKLTAESKTWTLQENSQNTLAQSRRIASTWDTIGWILYRQSKITEAESYIRPAWAERESAEIGEHLAEIAEAKGNPEEALRIWELALATFPNYLRPSVRKTPGATQKELINHIEALRKAGAKEPADDADATLKQLRTVSLGSSNGFTGSAEYRLLLSHGEVLDIQKISDAEVPDAREKIKAAKFPTYWPKGSEAQLVRNVMMICHAGVCELELEP